VRGSAEQVARWEPREGIGAGEIGQPILARAADGTLVPEAVTHDGVAWQPDWPVTLVDQEGIEAYLHHVRERDGLPWRLPHELEWEKAARGTDQRAFPWGRRFDPSFANMTLSARPPVRCPVDAFPTDESPFGVRGLGGNVRDRCANHYARSYATPQRLADWPADHGDPTLPVSRGGAWISSMALCRSATRFAGGIRNRNTSVGFRLCRTLVPSSQS
ncbi:MAG: SUMF1/EgtB/PvdO family nonheme iron enzyme, partial [Myxococcota bacterium]